MSDSVDKRSLLDVLATLHEALDVVQTVVLTSTTDPELLAGHRELERLRRRFDPAEYRLIGEENGRGLPGEYGCASTGRFLRHLLRVEPGEANARARAAGRYHHRLAEQLGWHTTTMINGRPHWVQPTWIDPKQHPVRNTLHDTSPAA